MTTGGVPGRALTRAITGLAVVIALILTVGLPAMDFLYARASVAASMQAEADLGAVAVSQLASRNTEMWKFEEARIRGLLSMIRNDSKDECRRVVDLQGRVVAQQPADLPAPTMKVSAPIYDSGVVVGHVEVARSQQPLIETALWLALPALALGGLAFAVLRLVPLRLLRRSLARASHLAMHDPLTDLPNRALFADRLEQALAWARRECGSLSLLCLDVDRFKDINDTLGHAGGDRLLVEVAARLRACLRQSDTVARLGGDEFAIVQTGAYQKGEAEALANRVLEAMAPPFDLDGQQVEIGLSIGVDRTRAGRPHAVAEHRGRTHDAGRPGALPCQGKRPGRLLLLRHRHESPDGGTAGTGSRPPRGAAQGAVRPALPAADRSSDWPDHRGGGAAPLGPATARQCSPRADRAAGGGNRTDRAAWRVGPQQGVPPGRGLAQADLHGGERLGGAVPPPRLRRRGGGRAAPIRAGASSGSNWKSPRACC